MNNDVLSIDAVSTSLLKQPLSTLENGSIKNNSSRIQQSNPSSKSSVNTTGVTASSGMSKDDTTLTNNHADDAEEESEAETVVMPGKGDADGPSPSGKKTIRHEGASSKNDNVISKELSDAVSNGATFKARSSSGSMRQEVTTTNTAPLNNGKSHTDSSLSSPTASTNSHNQQSRTRATSDYGKSGLDDPNRPAASRKRKASIHESEAKAIRRRIKLEDHQTDAEDRLSTRSESPRLNYPAASPTISTSKPKRRGPAPLLIGVSKSKRKQSLDGDSNESHSPQLSAAPRLPSGAVMPKRKVDKSGRTAFARACANGNLIEAQNALRLNPEDLERPDNGGNTPLQIAALEGHIDIVRLLLQERCNLETQNNDLKDTPLIDAVENSRLGVIRLLIEAGVNPRKVNAKGEEALDLVDLDNDDGPQIREELANYRSRFDAERRELSRRSPDKSRNRSPQDSPPATTKSKRKDLHLIDGNGARLLDYASKGDTEGVVHCLDQGVVADVETVYAAAKGGHVECLEMIFAISQPPVDPNPAPLKEFNKGYNTPMLIAIGRGKLPVVKLLLEQKGFDPTLRIHKNQTYYEIAEKRQGENWQEEVQMLKDAYHERAARDSKKGTAAAIANKSSRTSSPKDSKKAQIDRSPSANIHRGTSPSATRDSLTRKRTSGENIKAEHEDRAKEKRSRDGRPSEDKPDRQHLKVPSQESRENSDREGSPAAALRRSTSEREAIPRPRKRLVRGSEIEQQRGIARRTSSGISAQNSNKLHSAQEETKSKSLSVENDSEKKKAKRRSPSPQPEESPKRAKIHSQGVSHRPVAGSAKVSKKTPRISSPGSAPIANMGSSSRDSIRSGASQDTAMSDPEEKSDSKGVEKGRHCKPKLEAERKLLKEKKPADKQEKISTQEGQPITRDVVPENSIDDFHELSLGTDKAQSKAPSRSDYTIPSATADDDIEMVPTENESIVDMGSHADREADDTIVVEMANEQKKADTNIETENHTNLEITDSANLPKIFSMIKADPERFKKHPLRHEQRHLLCLPRSEIDPECPESEKDTLWVTNFQAALKLVDVDINFSAYPTWPRMPLLESHQNLLTCEIRPVDILWDPPECIRDKNGNLLREIDGKIVEGGNVGKPICYPEPENSMHDWAKNRKRDNLKAQFWSNKWFFLQLSDVQSIIPSFPHLQNSPWKHAFRVVRTAAQLKESQDTINREIEEREAEIRRRRPPKPEGWIWGRLQPELEEEILRLEAEWKREQEELKNKHK